MVISAQDICKDFAGDVVLNNVNIDIEEKARIGLLGVNGAGKTTFLNILTGLMEPESGHISRAKNLEIGYLQQNDALNVENTIEQEAHDAFKKTIALQAQINKCLVELENNPDNKELLTQYDRLSAQFEALDGYHMEDKINRVLNGLGFGDFDRDVKISTLSGGEKMRFGIAKMLMREPDLLILDEPTNHLDFEMLKWLEKYLETYKGAVLIVSHDRYFLDTVAKDICEIERGSLTRYKGGYASFVVQKADRQKVAMRQWEKQQEEIAKLEEFVAKNLAKSASINGVGTRVKALEKMERLEKPILYDKSISMNFTYDIEPFSTVLLCEDLGVAFKDNNESKQLFNHINLEVKRGEKIAIVGFNGVGKSTFLKAIQNKRPYSGKVRWGGNVRIGYFDQELSNLDMESTVIEALHSQYPQKTEYELRSLLGQFLLEGEDVFKKVKELSGANRAKVAFAILELQKPNVLILDEPTNHLDYQAKEVLENTLLNYTGTLIAVSHDRYFLRRVPGRILEMKPDNIHIYNGNYDYYLEKKEQENAVLAQKLEEEKQKKEQETDKNSGYRSKEQRALDAQKRNRIKELEKEIHQLEIEIEQNNEALSLPENSNDFEILNQISEQLQQATANLDKYTEEWILLSE